jgi:SAM-dependent methyltransferase
MLALIKSFLPRSLQFPMRSFYYTAYRFYIRCVCWHLELWEGRRAATATLAQIPPPILRYRVSGETGLNRFLEVSERAAQNVVLALEQAGVSIERCKVILDFGCGCGRVLTWLVAQFPDKLFFGTDVDEPAIEWCRDHLTLAQFNKNDLLPPLRYPSEMFDLVYAVSVFTHLNEELQLRWLAEIRRILKPSGVALFTVHGRCVWEKLSQPEVRKIEQNGFLFLESRKLKGLLPDWYQTTFHSEAYVMNEFGKFFKILKYIPEGMGYQDVVVGIRD